jgi:hypothetical protein
MFMRNCIPDYISGLELDLCRLWSSKSKTMQARDEGENLYAQSGRRQIVGPSRLLASHRARFSFLRVN